MRILVVDDDPIGGRMLQFLLSEQGYHVDIVDNARGALALVKTRAELDVLLDKLDPSVPFPTAATGPRGRQGSPSRVALPDGWLTDREDCTVPEGADIMHSGG